jgi:GntR family transcriptional regulator
MAIWFDIDPKSGAPIFKQIIEQVKRSVATGMLKPDERLPTVRELAEEHSINPNTIAKAYQNLEVMGLVYTRPGVRGGTFISTVKDDNLREAELLRFHEELRRLVRDGYNLSLEATDVISRFQCEVEKWYNAHPPPELVAPIEVETEAIETKASARLVDRGAKKL